MGGRRSVGIVRSLIRSLVRWLVFVEISTRCADMAKARVFYVPRPKQTCSFCRRAPSLIQFTRPLASLGLEQLKAC